jgi:hypothetical protein
MKQRYEKELAPTNFEYGQELANNAIADFEAWIVSGCIRGCIVNTYFICFGIAKYE